MAKTTNIDNSIKKSKNEKTKFILILLIPFVLFILIMVLSYIFRVTNFISDLIKKPILILFENFGQYNIITLLTDIAHLGIIYFVSYLVITHILGKYSRKKYSLLIFTILLSTYIFSAGIMFINLLFGERDNLLINIDTYDSHYTEGYYGIWDYNGYISCHEYYYKIMTEDYIHCYIYPEIETISGTVTIIYENKTKIDYDIDNDIYFKGSPKIEFIDFYITAYDSESSPKIMYSELIKPLNYDDNAYQKKSNFIIYTIALFGIVLFSVPLLVINMNNIYNIDVKKKPLKKKEGK